MSISESYFAMYKMVHHFIHKQIAGGNVDRLEKRIVELEQRTNVVVVRSPEWHITPDEALQIFDILAAAGAVENVMLNDWQELSTEYFSIGE